MARKRAAHTPCRARVRTVGSWRSRFGRKWKPVRHAPTIGRMQNARTANDVPPASTRISDALRSSDGAWPRRMNANNPYAAQTTTLLTAGAMAGRAKRLRAWSTAVATRPTS